jgi:hypothetical protein
MMAAILATSSSAESPGTNSRTASAIRTSGSVAPGFDGSERVELASLMLRLSAGPPAEASLEWVM